MHFQPGTQVQIATVDRISHDPANGDLSLPNAFDHALGQFWLCLEAHRFWDACGSTPIAILTPVQGQIEFAINQGMSFGRHIREKDSDLTVLNPASGSAILQANTSRFLASLGKTRFIDGQNSVLLTQ
jgi:hypothetical protein